MGYDDNTPLQGVTGGGLPAEIWQAVMAEIHEGLPPQPLGVIAPDAAGNMIVASDIVSADSDDPLAAALAEAVAAAQPVDDGMADVAQPGGATGMPIDAPAIVAASPDGAADPLAAALAEAMGEAAPAPEPARLVEPAPSAPPPAPVPQPVPVRSGPIGAEPVPPAPRTEGSTVSSSGEAAPPAPGPA